MDTILNQKTNQVIDSENNVNVPVVEDETNVVEDETKVATIVETNVVKVDFDIRQAYIDKDDPDNYDDDGNLITYRTRKLLITIDKELPCIKKKQENGQDVFYETTTNVLVVSAHAMTTILSDIDFEFMLNMAELKEATNEESISIKTLLMFIMKSQLTIDNKHYTPADTYERDGVVYNYEHSFYRPNIVDIEFNEKFYKRALLSLEKEVKEHINNK